jgi:peptidoglycan/LPS O-acetylase OafA/YrhL
VRLGEVSYSTYLVHWPILACLNVLAPAEWSRLVRAEALFVAGAPLTLLCSLLLYRYVECPGIALSRHLSKPKNEIRIESAPKPLAHAGILRTWDSIRGALLRRLTEKSDLRPESVNLGSSNEAKEPARLEAERR